MTHYGKRVDFNHRKQLKEQETMKTSGYITSKRKCNNHVVIKGNCNGYDFDYSYLAIDGESVDETLKRVRKEMMLEKFRIEKRLNAVRLAYIQD